MASITFAVDDELRAEMSKFSWVNWSELIKTILIERRKQAEQLLKRLHSKEEQELIKWSIELGKKAKKGRFKELLSELSKKTREELLSSMSSEKRENINKLK